MATTHHMPDGHAFRRHPTARLLLLAAIVGLIAGILGIGFHATLDQIMLWPQLVPAGPTGRPRCAGPCS